MPAGDALPVSAVEIREAIRTINQSALFAQSRRQARLLEYVCNMVLLGRQNEIKEYTIAAEVFDRTPEFNDKKDAIVRVEAHRLRLRLARYYATEGAHDRLVVELAPGGYIPKFVVRDPQCLPAEEVAPSPTAAPEIVTLAPKRRLRGRGKLLAGSGAALAVLLAGVLAIIRAGSPEVALRPSDPVRRSSDALPPASDGIRILAGSQAPYIDRAGHRWSADAYFQGGAAQPGPADFPGRPPDPSLYRWMRYGECAYDIPVPPGTYELRLYFAEPTFRGGTDVGSEGGENQRHFTVTVNGALLLDDFDVVTDSGMFPVDVRAFRDVTPAADGLVHLKFQAVMGPPFVNAIELAPGMPGRVLPIRIRAAQSSFTDHAGNVWSPDDYYVGGRLATHKGDVTLTPDPDLFASERYGNFSYAIPVPPGRYALTVYFAETFWDPQGESSRKGGSGARVFNLSCNGTTLLPSFDMLKEARPFQAISRTFHNLRPNAQGKLVLAFSPVNNYASVKAIEVTEEQRLNTH